MDFVLKPSLEHMALVKIVISLWNQNDVRALMAKLRSSDLYSSEEWERIEDRITGKVPQLSLPQILTEKVLCFVKPIGLQILGWMVFHSRLFSLCVNLPAELCWTPQGTVDRKKTAEVLVRDENLDIQTRYKLACIYCLEDDIKMFWNNMTEDLKESDWDKIPVINFWTRNMKRKELDSAHISYKYEFQQSVRWANKVAAEYFLQKLTPREREKCLVKAAKYETDTDVLYFLISELNEVQQMAVFKYNPYRVLNCFLKWPLQRFFIEAANCLWNFLLKNDYDIIFTNIFEKVSDGCNDWNYPELFREFWQKIPDVQKSLIIHEIDKSSLLPSLIRIKDKESIRLILKDANLATKKKLIYSDEINQFWQHFIHDNEWDFLEFFIRECLPSKKAMLKFKEKFEKHMSYCFKEYSAARKHKWNQLFQFSDDSICKCGKRSVEEGESSSSKQFRSLQ